jgi:hypothetical protein
MYNWYNNSKKGTLWFREQWFEQMNQQMTSDLLPGGGHCIQTRGQAGVMWPLTAMVVNVFILRQNSVN